MPGQWPSAPPGFLECGEFLLPWDWQYVVFVNPPKSRGRAGFPSAQKQLLASNGRKVTTGYQNTKNSITFQIWGNIFLILLQMSENFTVSLL